MKRLFIVIFSFWLLACGNSDQLAANSNPFQSHIPDTANNWYAKLYDYPFYLKKSALAEQLRVSPLEQGKDSFEIRLWTLASSYDPQHMYTIVHTANGWNVSQYRFYIRPGTWDNPIVDSQQVYRLNLTKTKEFINTIKFAELWSLQSQSEMPKGGSYGCMDGFAAMIEMADKHRYKYSFYNCPDINAAKDPVFNKVAFLCESLNSLPIQ